MNFTKKNIIFFLILIFAFSIPVNADTWISNSSIKNGLGDHGSDSTLTVFYYDGSFRLISGWGPGFHVGYNWSENTWISNSDIASGLPDIGYVSAPSVFLDGSTWKLISGEQDGILNGFYWSGDTWISDSSIINGTSSVGLKSKPCVFYHNSILKMIVGESDGVFNGYYWSVNTWISDSSIISGLPDVGERSTPCVFYDGDTLKLISGEFSGVFNGFYWSGDTWISDSDIISGLPDVGSDSAPFVFLDENVLKLISGEENGLFYGYTSGYTPPATTLMEFTNEPIEVSTYAHLECNLNDYWNIHANEHFYLSYDYYYKNISNYTIIDYNELELNSQNTVNFIPTYYPYFNQTGGCEIKASILYTYHDPVYTKEELGGIGYYVSTVLVNSTYEPPEEPEEPEEPEIPDPEPDPEPEPDPPIPPIQPNGTGVNQSINVSWTGEYYNTVNTTVDGLCSPIYNFTNWSLSPVYRLNDSIGEFNYYMNESFTQTTQDSSILYESINTIYGAIHPKIRNVITYYLIWVVLLIILKKD